MVCYKNPITKGLGLQYHACQLWPLQEQHCPLPKGGQGALLRMYVERIVKGSVDLSQKPGLLICPPARNSWQ